jgi:4-carboxymuconolactone decarboxylase
VAGRWGCSYQQRAHEPLAARAGLSAVGLATLAAGEVPSDLAPTDALAVRYALALSRDGRADEASVAALRAALGERGLVELTVLVGYYSMLALFLNGLAVGES